MTRVNLVLMLVLLASAITLVRQSYDGRRLFSDLHRAQSEAQALETEFERLQAERQAAATPLRVEKSARERLGMRSATPGVTHYVDLPPLAAAPASEPARTGLRVSAAANPHGAAR